MNYVIVIIIAILAIVVNFKPKLILEKIFKKEPENISENSVLVLKSIAAILAIVDFILVLVWL